MKLLINILFIVLLFYTHLSDAQTVHNVGQGRKFVTIKSAIEKAEPGDIIIIHSGNYNEGNIVIDKKLKIRGVNFPQISGNKKSEVFTIKADDVSIEGLKVINAGLNFLYENAGIRLDGVKNCKILNNMLIDNYFGIYLANSQNCLIMDNIIKSDAVSEAHSGNGIHLWYSKDIQIVSNKISGHRDGIYFEFVRQGLITNNISRQNLRYGLHFMFSDSCTYRHNTFEKNGAGVAVMYTKNVLMEENTFNDNWGQASYGILLKDITDSEIRKNNFIRNTTAIYSEACTRVNVINNIFTNNGWAVKLMANSMDNYFSGNDFISNTFDVSTNSRQNFNKFSGNFWSAYKGYDIDGDGRGDVPYRPVTLYSILIEQNPASVALMRSIFIGLLDAAESIFPSLTPETLKDDNPFMRRIN